MQEGAALGIHSRFPELLGGHFSEAFVALDDVLSAAFVQDVIEKFAGSMFLDDLRLFRATHWRFARFLLRLLGFLFLGGTQIFAFVSVVLAFIFVLAFVCVFGTGLRLCRSRHTLDHKRRLQILLNLLELGDELAAFRGRG